ncbi:MAG: tripartite tricarboxylate transporter substrate binding protein [Variovorax paradoxus]|nr:MAG: tripartite tricarboxylate transporter substrate binding protein [Variovorax paradoxus]PZQ01129.1 MAG: tripartite tricarboxylate transporter substrate binding protein [Variovorax paradoxus]
MFSPPRPTRLVRRALLMSLTLPLLHASAFASEPYPDKPVRVVVGFAPGGTNDILARLVSAKLNDRLKQAFVVDNKPGANSSIGVDAVAKAKPDGYTLLVASSGGLTTNPVLMKNLPYDPTKDLEPIALLGSFPLVVTVPASSPANNLRDLAALAKTTKDGALDHGVPTTSFQLVAETLATALNVRFNHISYRGSGLVVSALLGNEVQIGIMDSPAVMGQVKAGKLKALAVTTAKRSSALPDVPTVAESGVPGYDAPIWTALMAPKGTPEPVLAKLRSVVSEILHDKDFIEKLQAQGMDPGEADAPALAKRISSDITRWAAVAKAANIQPQ